MCRKDLFRYTEDTCYSNGKYCSGLSSHFIAMHSEFYNSQSIATGEQTHIDHSSKTLGFRYKCWDHFTGPTRIISEPIIQKLGFCRWRELKRKLVIFTRMGTAHCSGPGFECFQRIRSSDTSDGTPWRQCWYTQVPPIDSPLFLIWVYANVYLIMGAWGSMTQQ